MATHTSVKSFALAIEAMSVNQQRNGQRLLRQSALAATQVMRSQIMADTGDGLLSGTATRTARGESGPRKINARFDVAQKATVRPTAIVSATGKGGPWALIDPTVTGGGIPPHVILPIGLGRALRQRGAPTDRRRRRSTFSETLMRGEAGTFAGLKPMTTPAGVRYAVYFHPGVPPGRMPQTWTKGKAKAEKVAQRIIRSRWAQLPLK